MARIPSVVMKALAVLLLFGMLFGALALVFVPYDLWRMARAREWPSRKVEIVTSYALSHRSSRGGRYWDAQICGRALDSGERLCITRVRFGSFRWGEGREAAEAAAARYPVGSIADLYYDPADPRERILEPHAPATTLIAILGVGIAFLLTPLALWLIRQAAAGGLRGDRYRG